ncbi:hypothetical protein CHLRE_05g243352v5 [Chlamydomonas reinhardtii]|uniref:Uncharacterized protein n=1 Tax=Chlamydomonas reinhardtii TaxID=3055 RepID=A0A2K3DSD3_CHLRE|nr:uncharacterized protein CHLRE_05g243352v5 [Chlamydomonas reinhardtii]PNW83442.1 hypothetical protein CHLRE_05g243352v5 [Chlamydomonas reinhardtii]
MAVQRREILEQLDKLDELEIQQAGSTAALATGAGQAEGSGGAGVAGVGPPGALGVSGAGGATGSGGPTATLQQQQQQHQHQPPQQHQQHQHPQQQQTPPQVTGAPTAGPLALVPAATTGMGLATGLLPAAGVLAAAQLPKALAPSLPVFQGRDDGPRGVKRPNPVDEIVHQGASFSQMVATLPLLGDVAKALHFVSPTSNQFRFGQAAGAQVAELVAEAATLGTAAGAISDPSAQASLARCESELLRSAVEAQATQLRLTRYTTKVPWKDAVDFVKHANPQTVTVVDALAGLSDSMLSHLLKPAGAGAAAGPAGAPPPPPALGAAAAAAGADAHNCHACHRPGHNFTQCPALADLRRSNPQLYDNVIAQIRQGAAAAAPRR